MKIAHARAVSIAFTIWMVCLLWLWPRAVRASTLSSEFKLYDWESLGYAAALGSLGGFLALIYALATDRRVVVTVLGESLRNGIVSPIAGATAFLGIRAAAAMGWFELSTEPRFLVIVGAGFAGIAFIQWARDLAGKGAAALGSWLVRKGDSA